MRRIVLLFYYLTLLLACDEKRNGKNVDVDPNTFKNPIMTSSPDPWVFEHQEKYYVTYTTGNNIRLYVTEEMSDLAFADNKVIWTAPSTGFNSRNIWAPEIHFANGKWYIYYAADDGNNENHRMWVLENSSADPLQGEWIDRGELELPGDKWAIDGTLAVIGDATYFAWSGWETNENVRQDIYIVQMEDPLTPVGDRVRISSPEFPWELHGGTPSVNEAPQFLIRDNMVFVTFSASGCWTDEYSIGLLSVPSDQILTAASWEKSEQPVLTKNASALAFGPGHNAFFKSKDGSEDWIVYHANTSSNAGCSNERSMRMQKFRWENGQPVFGQPVAVGAAVKVPSGEN